MSSYLCLDSSVFLKWLSVESEEHSSQAVSLIEQSQSPLIAPAFTWAEVGSALRKKVRMGVMTEHEVEKAWQAFTGLGVEFIHSEVLAQRAWELAKELALPTVYDASFLAVAELAPDGPCPFWTADEKLVRDLAGQKAYVRHLAQYS